jgi:hypothetical protein
VSGVGVAERELVTNLIDSMINSQHFLVPNLILGDKALPTNGKLNELSKAKQELQYRVVAVTTENLASTTSPPSCSSLHW